MEHGGTHRGENPQRLSTRADGLAGKEAGADETYRAGYGSVQEGGRQAPLGAGRSPPTGFLYTRNSGHSLEEAWRSLKSGLRLRPVHHWLPHRIEAHVSIAVLALLLERMAERACGDTWRNIRDRLKRIQLAQLLSGKKTVWQVTEPTKEARKMLKQMKLDEPAPILRID